MSKNPATPVSPEKLDGFVQQMHLAQSMRAAIAAGVCAAIVAAAAWSGVTVWSGYQIGWMSIGVGWLVGSAVRWAGHGVEARFGLVGAACTLLGCALGNLASSMYFLAGSELANVLAILPQVRWQDLFYVLQDSFAPIDLLFYAIAVGYGYYAAFRHVSDAELAQLAE